MGLPGRELQNQVMMLCDDDTHSLGHRLIIPYHYNVL